jgi:hypothetical protein
LEARSASARIILNYDAAVSEKQILCRSQDFTFSHSQGHFRTSLRPCARSALPLATGIVSAAAHVRKVPIVLQNSKVAAVKLFGENLKRKEVDDSHSFSRATEVAYEFGARR